MNLKALQTDVLKLESNELLVTMPMLSSRRIKKSELWKAEFKYYATVEARSTYKGLRLFFEFDLNAEWGRLYYAKQLFALYGKKFTKNQNIPLIYELIASYAIGL